MIAIPNPVFDIGNYLGSSKNKTPCLFCSYYLSYFTHFVYIIQPSDELI
jgi:hypothetical protein